MTTQPLHPDHLKPGDKVGTWNIVQVLGRGGSSRVFKVERDGLFYAMKAYLLPLSGNREELAESDYVEEVSTYRKLAREVAALFTYASHPNLLRVHAVDFWPNPHQGYGYLITDFVDGDNWHEWRWKQPAHAVRLVDTFSSLVRTVGALHARGVFHRDLKAENILIRREDGRPFLIDFGTVRLPGALTQTIGLPEGALHLVPPELLAYTRSGEWARGQPFEGGAAVDLYALGVLLYQALTDLHPFSPELPDEQLLVAIAQVPPTAPHLLNPLVPRSLSDIAMKLLEKRPEARYPSAPALLKALEAAMEGNRDSPAWRVPLTPADPQAVGDESVEEGEAPQPEEASPQEKAPPQKEDVPEPAPSPPSTQPPVASLSRRGWLLAAVAGLLLAAFGLLLWRGRLDAPPEAEPGASVHDPRGTQTLSHSPQDSTPPRSALPGLVAVSLCAAVGVGCPAVQVWPKPETCTQEAQRNTFEVLKLDEGMELRAVIDIHQPGDPLEEGTYHDGPITSRVVQRAWSPKELPGGTLLYGRLWTGPGILDREGDESVMGRYTEAKLPDGRTLSVCLTLGGPDGRWEKSPGSQTGAARLPREVPVSAVQRWP